MGPDDLDLLDLDPVDREALERAIELARKQDAGRRRQIDDMLADPARPWFETATFASYVMQCRTLHLKPWQTPPVHADEDADAGDAPHTGYAEAQALLRRLLAAGLSRWEPEPLKRLA